MVQPHGTVTFLFTDVEASTGLWDHFPEAMRTALTIHDEILRSSIGTFRGHVFSTAGDAYSAAFWTPGDALGAALAAQRALDTAPWPEPAELRVRMGMHTGTAHERDGDYFGSAVNRAARVMSAAHGGQIVMSLATEQLLRDHLPDGVRLVDVGAHPLKGLSRPEQVFQVSSPGLRSQFPPLRTEAVHNGNLPASATSFIGRGDEVQRLVGELREQRLITLTGVGGVGKTRLALEAARAVADDFPGGVWLSELGPLDDPDAVVHAVAATLSARPHDGLSIVDSVIDALRGRKLLLILDNCEHVLDAAAELVGQIAAACPTVTVVATSREPIGVAAERVWAVRSLVPEVEGVELFRDRAAAADAAFASADADLEVITEICTRLDGIPLAIELAAARVRSMSTTELASRLNDRFRVLRGTRRGGLERHQTLRATVQWSYQLLDEDQALLFDRLAVFAGSFDVAAAQDVCADGRVEHRDVEDLLVALVDKSMVVAERGRTSTRYRLLETLRQFGEEQLAGHDDLGARRDRHLAHYTSVATRAKDQYEGHDHMRGAATLHAEWDNFRAAMQWAITEADVTQAAALLRAGYWFAWFDVRHELGSWADQLLEHDGSDATVYGVAAFFAAQRGEFDRSIALADAGLSLEPARSSGAWICRYSAAMAYSYSGRPDEAWTALEAVRDVVDQDSEPFSAAGVASTVALNAFAHGHPADAARERELLTDIASTLDNPCLDSIIHWVEASAAMHDGQLDAATAHLDAALASAEACDNRLMIGMTKESIAVFALDTNRPAAAAAVGDAVRTSTRCATGTSGRCSSWLPSAGRRSAAWSKPACCWDISRPTTSTTQ